MPVRRRLFALLLAAALSATLLTSPAQATGRPRVDVVGLGVAEARALLESRRVTSVELVREYLRRIDAYENAYAGQPEHPALGLAPLQ
ncbi:hypothetical protein [Prauserella flavalba]|uniref:Amidase n=1 Tax=Prauserella flavalba TaxID=1477506 RepID=A0A318M0N5_9PSEU|nr:hypothetical protein [Prauserella flavalba]PXY38249.1 hypothetical protein BA062_00335 [Prauserella flavalba]